MQLFSRNLLVRFSVVCVVLAFISLAGHACAAEASEFRAGASISNITPPLGVPIVGNWDRPEATHIHDDLHVRSLVLDDGEQRLVIAMCDNLHISSELFDEARARLVDTTGIPAENMLLASTHTHSGPEARSPRGSERLDYGAFVVERIVDGVQCAINNLEAAQIGWGSAEEPGEVFNRRWFMKDPQFTANPFGGRDKVRMNPPRGHDALDKPAGPTDPEIAFLSVRSASGRPIALLANYSLHYVGGVPDGHISADYFGVFANRIQELLGADRLDPPFVGILSNGTSADINNINFRNPRGKREPYEQMNHVANLVAEKVHAACQSIPYHDHVELGARASTLTLGTRKPDDVRMAWAREILAKPESETETIERIYAGRMQSLRDRPDTVEIVVQAFRIGEVGIAAIPFETFAETGLHLKEKSPFPMAFTISHANGANGYLPTPAQHELGGYETWLGTSRVEVGAEPAIVDRLLEQFGALAAE